MFRQRRRQIPDRDNSSMGTPLGPVAANDVAVGR